MALHMGEPGLFQPGRHIGICMDAAIGGAQEHVQAEERRERRSCSTPVGEEIRDDQ